MTYLFMFGGLILLSIILDKFDRGDYKARSDETVRRGFDHVRMFKEKQ